MLSQKYIYSVSGNQCPRPTELGMQRMEKQTVRDISTHPDSLNQETGPGNDITVLVSQLMESFYDNGTIV